MFKIGDEINCTITEIDKEKRRVAISQINFGKSIWNFSKKYPVGTITKGEIVNKNEYSLFKNWGSKYWHFLGNDLTYLNNGEEELAKYKKGDKINIKILEIKLDEQKIRVGHKQTLKDLMDWFNDKKKTKLSQLKSFPLIIRIMVRPEGCEMDLLLRIAK